MQNLDAYQAIELQKQLAKMQMINSFQGYIQKALSLSMAQQAILQPGMTYPQFNGLCPNNRASLMQPAYFDPNTLFGPSLTMLNTNTPQIEPRMVNQSATMNISAQNDLPLFKFQTMPLQSPQVKPQQPMQSTQLLELPPLPIKKKCEPADDGFEDLTDFFGKKASNASTKSSWSAREDDEFDTGKKITLEKEIYIKNPGLPTQKARKRTKVICGHPWKNHHAKVNFNAEFSSTYLIFKGFMQKLLRDFRKNPQAMEV